MRVSSIGVMILLISLLSIGAFAGNVAEVYFLYEMAGGEVVKIVTGKKGEKLQLLKNPTFQKWGDGEVPLAPKDPIWEDVPDGTYKTRAFGGSFIVKDSRIVKEIDSNGNDVTKK